MTSASARRRPAAVAALALAGLLGPAWAAQAAPPVIYVSQPAAQAIAESSADALRQGPARPDEWPRDLVLGKVSGTELARLDAEGMAATLRDALAASPAGVGVDELLPRDWTAASGQALADALRMLGPERASRVVLYVSPGIVSRVGTTDPGRALAPDLAATVQALRLAGAVVLEMYRGDASPRTAAEYAAFPTRWLPRFPGADADRLRIMTGPAGGQGQQALWAQVRSTAAGRRILANGPAVYGLRTRQEGLDWARAYADFQADPAAGADTPVAALGTLAVYQSGARALRLSTGMRARVVVQLLPAGGGPRRVLGPFYGPMRDRVVAMPPRLRAGRYTAVAVSYGEGMREEARAQVVLGAAAR